MQKFDTVVPYILQTGNYIRLGGNGIVDGLKGMAAKKHLYKVVEIAKDGIILKAYRAKNYCFLPDYRFGQNMMEVYTEKEYKKLTD